MKGTCKKMKWIERNMMKHEQNQKNIAGKCMETHTDIRKVKGTMKGMKAKAWYNWFILIEHYRYIRWPWLGGRGVGTLDHIYIYTYIVFMIYYSFRSKTCVYILTDSELELIDSHGGSRVVVYCYLCNDIKDEVWELECDLHIGHQS